MCLIGSWITNSPLMHVFSPWQTMVTQDVASTQLLLHNGPVLHIYKHVQFNRNLRSCTYQGQRLEFYIHSVLPTTLGVCTACIEKILRGLLTQSLYIV